MRHSDVVFADHYFCEDLDRDHDLLFHDRLMPYLLILRYNHSESIPDILSIIISLYLHSNLKSISWHEQIVFNIRTYLHS